MRIVDADKGRLPALVALNIACWRHSYQGLVDASALASVDAACWLRRLETRFGDPVMVCLVAEGRGGAPLGFCEGGPSREGAFADAGEIRSLYVAPGKQGRGTGRALLEAMSRRLRERGFPRLIVKTLLGNPQSRGFYEACGGRLAGESSFELGGRRYPEAVYLLDPR